MNKTRKRAVQKHRAKDQKFAARRKAETEMAGGARARAQMQAPAPTVRPKPAARSQAEQPAEERDTTIEQVEQPPE